MTMHPRTAAQNAAKCAGHRYRPAATPAQLTAQARIDRAFRLRSDSMGVQAAARDVAQHPLMRRRQKALRQAWKRGRLASVARALRSYAETTARLQRAAP